MLYEWVFTTHLLTRIMRRPGSEDLRKVLEFAIPRAFVTFTEMQDLLEGVSPTYLTRYYLSATHRKSWLLAGYLEQVRYNPRTGELVAKRGRKAYRITARGGQVYFQLTTRTTSYPEAAFSSWSAHFASIGYVCASLEDFTHNTDHRLVMIGWKERTNQCFIMTCKFRIYGDTRTPYRIEYQTMWRNISEGDTVITTIENFVDEYDLDVDPLEVLLSLLQQKGELSRIVIAKVVEEWLKMRQHILGVGAMTKIKKRSTLIQYPPQKQPSFH